MPYDRNLFDNLPIFDGPLPNFDKVVVDPDKDPLIKFFGSGLPKGEKSKRHIEMLQRMESDKKRIAKNNTSHWQRIKQLALSRFKQKEIITKAVGQIEND